MPEVCFWHALSPVTVNPISYTMQGPESTAVVNVILSYEHERCHKIPNGIDPSLEEGISSTANLSLWSSRCFPKPGNLFSDAHHGFQTFSCGEHLFVVKIAEGDRLKLQSLARGWRE